MSDKIKASVGILTLNSEKELPRTLESLGRFEDVYICDGNSTDRTQDIARSYGARITKQFDTDEPNQRITSFGEARTRCLNQGKYEWHVRVDSDEYLSPEVVEEIAAIISSNNGEHLVYKMPRKYVWHNTVIDDTITYPNQQMRFFNRKAAPRFEKITHERLYVIPGTSIGFLQNPMLVPIADSYVEHDKQKTRRALNWDKLQYEKHMTLETWLGATMHTAALLTLYTLREIRVRFISKGNKFPFSYEWWRFKYQILTWLLATVTLFKKTFGNNRELQSGSKSV
jgi:glycosyltransferase involved in cell wall biosynthesis